jgi:flagellar M-ring protein FliF
MEFFRQLIEGIVAAWGKLNASAKVNIGLAAAAVVVAVVLVVTWGGRPNYVVLYSNLAGDDANKIVTYLDGRGIQYQVAAGGTAIRVPSSRVYELRNALAGQGLPTGGGVGFEIFDQSPLSATEFRERISYERALNGELARTISALDAVRTARVRVTIPEEALYADDKAEPRASVLVSLARPGVLSREEVNAILHLVAGVKGLRENNIAIVDTQGNVLASPTGDTDSVAELTSRQRQEIAEYEGYLENKAERELQEALGTRRCVVTVSATLNFDQMETVQLNYGEAVARSEETSKETINTTQALPRGPVGATAGLPTPGAGTVGTTTNKQLDRTITQSAVPETWTSTKPTTGTVTKVVVFAGIEGTWQTDETSGESTYQPLDATEIETYTGLVRTAVNADETRGDVITVSDMPFAEPVVAAALPGAPWYSGLPVAQIVLGVAALVAFVLLRSTLAKMAAAPKTAPVELIPEEKFEVSEGAAFKEKVKEQIATLSTEQPDVVASVLRTWLAEE